MNVLDMKFLDKDAEKETTVRSYLKKLLIGSSKLTTPALNLKGFILFCAMISFNSVRGT